MPAFTSIVINDGQGTPVAHTFSPLNKEGGAAYFVDRSPANAVGWLKVKHEIVMGKTPTAANRVKIDFTCPVLATINSVLTKVRMSSSSQVFNFAPDATDQERKDLRAYNQNWLGHASVKTSIETLEPFYA